MGKVSIGIMTGLCLFLFLLGLYFVLTGNYAEGYTIIKGAGWRHTTMSGIPLMIISASLYAAFRYALWLEKKHK